MKRIIYTLVFVLLAATAGFSQVERGIILNGNTIIMNEADTYKFMVVGENILNFYENSTLLESITLTDNPIPFTPITPLAMPELSGTVTINGYAVFDQTLTAVTTALTSDPAGTTPTGFTYKWRRGTTSISGATESTSKLVKEDVGLSISVVVSAGNCMGSVESPATAVVARAPQTTPAAPTMESNTTTSITLTSIGDAEYRRGTTGAWQDNRTFSELTAGTSYGFQQRLKESNTHFASDASAEANLSTVAANVAPSFTTHPTNQSVLEGETATFTVVVAGNPAPTLQWQAFNGREWNNISNSVNISGATNAKLTINNIPVSLDNSLIRCVATNSVGTANSNEVTLEVTALPDGSADNPFLVNSVATLQKVGSEYDGWGPTKHYRQTANITLGSSISWTPIGYEENPFTGTYDGGGYSVNNLTISSTNYRNLGLFGYIGKNGVVKNVALRSVSINHTGSTGTIGGIASENFGTIENCYVTGTISGNDFVGGVVGTNIGGVIKNCYTTCTVTGRSDIGGIVGENNGSSITVEACYATGKITGSNYVGGIVGIYSIGTGTVRNCVALNSEVVATNNTGNVGRVLGYNVQGTLANNYARATGMILKNGSGDVEVRPIDSILSSKHGSSVSTSTTFRPNIYETSFWNSAFGSNANLWDLTNLSANRLPRLKTTTGSNFSETQNSRLP